VVSFGKRERGFDMQHGPRASPHLVQQAVGFHRVSLLRLSSFAPAQLNRMYLVRDKGSPFAAMAKEVIGTPSHEQP